jgi:transposase-like protein
MSDQVEQPECDHSEGKQLDITSYRDVPKDMKRYVCETCDAEYTVPFRYPTEDDITGQAW